MTAGQRPAPGVIDDGGRVPVYAQCAKGRCGERWIVCYTPMTLATLPKAAKVALQCPKCGTRNPRAAQ